LGGNTSSAITVEDSATK